MMAQLRDYANTPASIGEEMIRRARLHAIGYIQGLQESVYGKPTPTQP